MKGGGGANSGGGARIKRGSCGGGRGGDREVETGFPIHALKYW